ncbi:MAG: hypothetical protein R6U58_12575 [Bacteroidales bacterium]
MFEEPDVEPATPGIVGMEQLIQLAGQAFENYIRYTGTKDFDMASQALYELEETLQEMGQLQQSGNQ